MHKCEREGEGEGEDVRARARVGGRVHEGRARTSPLNDCDHT